MTEGIRNPTWATVLDNAVYDDKGRIALRKGYSVDTTTPIYGGAATYDSGGRWSQASTDIGTGSNSNRMLVVTWTSSTTITGIEYGGQAMTQIGTTSSDSSGTGTQYYSVWYLLETGIAAATGSLLLTQGASTGGGAYWFASAAAQQEPACAVNHVADAQGTGPHTITGGETTTNIGNGTVSPTGALLLLGGDCLGTWGGETATWSPSVETQRGDDAGNGGTNWTALTVSTNEDVACTFGADNTEPCAIVAVGITSATAANNAGIKVLHEFLLNDGTERILAFTDDHRIFQSTDDGATFSDVTRLLTTTTTKWSFVNFNGYCYATAPGHKVWELQDTGGFTQVTGSNATRGVLLAAFGRLWATRDGSSAIDYSALLDGTDWSGTGSGSIDTANVWTQGYDRVRALAAFGSTFVAFGRNHILMYVDGSGSVLGIDPDNMYVVDTVEGTGIQEKDSLVNIGEGDLWFISGAGLQSLSRVVTDKSNPLVTLSRNQEAKLRDLMSNQTGEANSVQGVYSPEEHMVLFSFTGDNEYLMYDTQRRSVEDGSYRCALWTGMSDREAVLVRRNGDVIFGLTSGEVATYQNYRDDAGSADTIYELVYATPWMDAGEHNKLKISKGFYGHFYGRETLTATARWAFDFRPLEFSETFTNDYVSSGAEFGAGEFGEDEFGTGHRFRRQYTSGMGEGQFVKLWITIQSTDVDAVVAIQEVGMTLKYGRQV